MQSDYITHLYNINPFEMEIFHFMIDIEKY